MFAYFLICSVIIGIKSVSSEKFQNITNEYENSTKIDEIQDVARYFNNFLFTKIPPFDLTISDDITPKCRLHSAEYQRHLQNLTFWAIKMYDSAAKIPSGILNGNINQFGDFDECVNSHSNDGEISGQYCLANFLIDEPNSKYLSKLYNLVNSHFLFRSYIDSPGHIAPRFSAINWALCVPSSCTYEDVELGLKIGLQSLMDQTGISIQIKVYEEMCQTAERSIPLSTILGGLFFVAVIGFTLFVTAYDYYFQYPLTDLNGIQGMLFAFSLRRTVKSLFSLNRVEADISSVHGIRFYNMLMIYIIHKSLFSFYAPYVNRTVVAERMAKPWTVPIRVVSLYTDTFLMFSGMLTIYSYFGRINRGKSINIIEEYITRLFRILPPLLALILFMGLIAPWLGSGPQWDLIITHHSQLCKNYWWRNLLFIQNYFGAENICAGHTHHIGTDTQLFIASPIIFWILFKWQNRGVIILLACATVSTILRYYVAYTNNLSLFFYYGATHKTMFESANKLYILPTHRATVYIIGVVLGYYLRTMKTVILKPAAINIGHATAIALFCAAFFGPAFMGDISYKYDPIHAAYYTAFAPIAWCLSIAWVIFTKHFRYRNIVNKFFSWPGFRVTTRLSYAIYLTQVSVFFHNSASARNSEYYNELRIVLNVHEICVVICVSIALTLLFDLPFQTIKKICFRKEENKIIVAKED